MCELFAYIKYLIYVCIVQNVIIMNIENLHTPHQNCLHPIKVNNGGATILVPCGHCAACRISRSNVLVQMCNIETIMHPNLYFITLTYSDKFVPYFEVNREVPREAYEKGYNCSFRLRRNKELPTDSSDDATFYAQTSERELSMILEKQQSPMGKIMALYRADTQRFIKRLNGKLKRYFKKHGHETFKMRYFLCGEYGPLHLRPHYHLLLWFDTPIDCSELATNIHSCWSFGRTDTQVATGGCGSYVSGYLNSYSCVPQLFARCRPFRGFSTKSNRLGFDFLTSQKDEIYCSERISPSEMDSSLLRFWTKIQSNAPFVFNSRFDEPYYPIDGKYVPIFFYRYVKNWYFPTTVRYNQSDRGVVKEDFLLYEYATRYYSDAKSLSEIVRCIIDDIRLCISNVQSVRKGEVCNTYYPNNDFYGFLANMSTYVDDSRYFLRGWSSDSFLRYLQKVHICSKDNEHLYTNERNEYDRLFSRLYVVLSISKHFIVDICEGVMSDVDYYLDVITSYHAQNEQSYWDSCIQLAEYESELSSFDDEFAKHCFPDSYNSVEFENTKLYKYYSESIQSRADNRIKHKVMNDFNKVLFN